MENKENYENLMRVYQEKQTEIKWYRKKIKKNIENERENQKVSDNYHAMMNNWLVKNIVIPRLKRKNKFKGEDNYTKKDIKILKKSPLFDREWYMKEYPDISCSNLSAEEHYLKLGWKEYRNPSADFSTKEYVELNPGVLERDVCPLLHFEKKGKYEGKHYRIEEDKEKQTVYPSESELSKYIAKEEKRNDKLRKIYRNIDIDDSLIVFKTFQTRYTCNPKYICEELLKRENKYKVVWLYNPNELDMYEYPRGVRLMKADSKDAKKALSRAKVVVENGCALYDDVLELKDGQYSICTWHGSLGFKKMGADANSIEDEKKAIEKFSKANNVLISNSTFEEDVYKTSHWPNTNVWRLGHARNDILFRTDDDDIKFLKYKICLMYNIPVDANLALYAPTFREGMLSKSEGYVPKDMNKDIYKIDYEATSKALSDKFGGEWYILVKHHYVNKNNKRFKSGMKEHSRGVSGYGDIQELMAVCDVGITDYSSWICDYMLTRKPGFLFAVDADEFELNRGMYYPLNTSPFPIARNNDELVKEIAKFDLNDYKSKVNTFLEDKGCMDDGNASKRIVDKLEEILKPCEEDAE